MCMVCQVVNSQSTNQRRYIIVKYIIARFVTNNWGYFLSEITNNCLINYISIKF